MEDELDVSTESSEIFPGKLPRDSFSEDSKAINESLKDDAEDTDERDYVHDVDVPSDGPRKGWLGKLGKGKSRVAVRRVRKISTEDAAVHDAAPSHPVREREPLPPVTMSHHSSQLQHHEKAQEHLLKKPQPQDNPRLHRRPVHGSVSTG
eukprot:gene38655-50772_t